MRKIPWCIYTFIISIIPLCTKIFIFFLLQETTVSDAFKNPLDFVWSGLILQMATSYEIITVQETYQEESPWRITCIIISVFQVAAFVILYTLVSIGMVYEYFLSQKNVWGFSVGLWIASLCFAFEVYRRLRKQQKEIGK